MFIISNEITNQLNLMDSNKKNKVRCFLLDWMSVNGDTILTEKYRDQIRDRKIYLLTKESNIDEEISKTPFVKKILSVWSEEVLYRKSQKTDARRQGLPDMTDLDFFEMLDN